MKNGTIKNSTSNPSIKQALRTQAQQILPVLTAAFSKWQYSEISHQRIGQQDNIYQDNNQQLTKTKGYQGLTRAQHSQFGYVMIKWALSDSENSDTQSLSDLYHEVNVLTALEEYQQVKNSLVTIASPLLVYDILSVQIRDRTQQLTILVLPYYPNGSLAHQLSNEKHKTLTTEKKHHFIVQTITLIADFHDSSWLHNDIKPSNILLSSTLLDNADSDNTASSLLLTDFGLAEPINKPMAANPAGTPAYLAPERWQEGQSATVQSDIYAFGIMMVEILIGERPFSVSKQSSDPMIDWAIQHCQQPVPKLPLAYSRYQCIVEKALSKRTAKRYQSMEEILSDLTLL